MSRIPDQTFNDLPADAEVVSRARTIFRSACEDTDSYHALRLGLARRKALHAGAAHSALRLWAPLAGAAACCALAAGVVWMHPARPRGQATTRIALAPGAAAPADSEETVIPEVDSSQMDMVQDLDFYRWLATQPAVVQAPSRGSR